jgi:hypothetical protein
MSKQIAFFGFALSLMLLTTSNAACQNEIIVDQRPMIVQSLSGQVQLGDSRDGVKGVLVEDCASDWKVVKTSTHTDDNGHFNLPNASRKQMHYLRLSLLGAHTLLVKVKVDRSGQKELSLILAFST